jgi:spore germination cell wall hydrolase CwlJ-like protein
MLGRPVVSARSSTLISRLLRLPGLALCVAGLAGASVAEESPADAPVMAYAAEAAGAEATPALEAIGSATMAAAGTAAAVAPTPAPIPMRLRRERGVPPPSMLASAERECLATAIYFEARGEPLSGQVAVAQVVLNRVHSTRYPDSICEVVYQNDHRRNACQFSFACDGIPDRTSEEEAWQRAKKISDAVVAGQNQIRRVTKATHYHATYVAPYWAPSMHRVGQIGAHVFYKT